MAHLGSSETIPGGVDIHIDQEYRGIIDANFGEEGGNFGGGENGNFAGGDEIGSFTADTMGRDNFHGEEGGAATSGNTHEGMNYAGEYDIEDGTRVTREIGSGIVKMAVIPQVAPGTRVTAGTRVTI